MQLLNTYVQQPKKTVQQLTKPIADGFTVNPLGPLGSLSPLVHQNLQKLPTKPIQLLKHPITADTNVDAAAKKADTSANKTDTAAQKNDTAATNTTTAATNTTTATMTQTMSCYKEVHSRIYRLTGKVQNGFCVVVCLGTPTV